MFFLHFLLSISNHHREKHRGMWKICKFFTHLNTFVYQDKRIYIELDDDRKIYSVKVMESKMVCLQVPLKSWTRLRTARLSSKIVQRALQIREKNELKKHRVGGNGEGEQEQLNNRIAKMENTLQTMENTLKMIVDKLDKLNK